MSTKEERRENDLLASELGYEQGHPRYQWRFSENLYMPFRVEGGTIQTLTPGGVWDVQPKYELRKAAKHLTRQWVVCKWMDPGEESDWLQSFGKDLEYPRNGIYFPTNVYLDPELNPWDTDEAGVSLTKYIIGIIREQAKKSLADFKAEGEAIIANREKAQDHARSEKIDEVLNNFPFGHIEAGKRNTGISFPGTNQNGPKAQGESN